MSEKFIAFCHILEKVLECDEYAIPPDVENYSDIVWFADTKKCSESDFNSALAEYDAKQYQRDRAVAYDPIPEQLDQIYHDIDGWKAKIKAVKDKYPKP
jgi:hypothetical protein